MAEPHRPPPCPTCSLRPCKCDMIDAAIQDHVSKADTDPRISDSDDFDIVDNSVYPAAIPIPSEPVRVRVLTSIGVSWVSSAQSG
jgi:hypothetical protein